ncbi:unnamed protein product [Phaedon cochleariae]|uniref:Myb/SANT-like DNA-binding domain-containing protein n=1 Tax=Phaedon cochleariae TaxID=80249 RepID=A0A9N9SN04_PHACE|nr:unnamed protein product [Phaedon cochleariae]
MFSDFTYAESLLRHARSQDEHQTPGTSNEAPVQKSLVEERRSMECHYEDLAHPKRRRSVFTNVVNDLLSSGFAVDETMCQAKWKNLVRSYNIAKDQKTRTGRGPTRFQFFEELDNLLEEANCVVNVDEVNCTLVIEEDDSDRDKANNDEIYTEKKNNAENKEKGKKRKRTAKNESILKEINLEKSKRHQERMDIEQKKIEMEERKCRLLERYLDSKV